MDINPDTHAHMSKDEFDKEDESNAFQEAMRGVKPLNYSKIPLAEKPSLKKSKALPKKKSETENTEESLNDPFSEHENLQSVGPDDVLFFARPGLQQKILRNLRNGKYTIEAVLDLHGMSVVAARKSLALFLHHCQENDFNHVLVIHGKGHNGKMPILKNKINHWLRQTEEVLAFSSATTRHGRTGSVYVLLKGN